MDDRSSAEPGEQPPCRCREWVEQELARLRLELADEVRTRRIRVAAGIGTEILIEAGEQLAVVRVGAAGGQVGAEMVASADETEAYAGLSLAVRGDDVAVLSALQPYGGGLTEARLVFDRPQSGHPHHVEIAEKPLQTMGFSLIDWCRRYY